MYKLICKCGIFLYPCHCICKSAYFFAFYAAWGAVKAHYDTNQAWTHTHTHTSSVHDCMWGAWRARSPRVRSDVCQTPSAHSQRVSNYVCACTCAVIYMFCTSGRSLYTCIYYAYIHMSHKYIIASSLLACENVNQLVREWVCVCVYMLSSAFIGIVVHVLRVIMYRAMRMKCLYSDFYAKSVNWTKFQMEYLCSHYFEWITTVWLFMSRFDLYNPFFVVLI